ncbi:MAG: GlsB/YeaQ/YmgE family stress response membrane protein [Lysobacteraceae bacterium]
MIHIIWSIILGFIAGLIARAVLPGADSMGFLMTTGLGIVGSLIGGLIGNMIKKPAPGATFHPAGLLMSIVGAIIALLAWRYLHH